MRSPRLRGGEVRLADVFELVMQGGDVGVLGKSGTRKKAMRDRTGAYDPIGLLEESVNRIEGHDLPRWRGIALAE
jgi:hypothetical protein